MKRILSAVLAFPSLAIAAAQETAATEAATPEPLGTVYLVCIALVFIALLVGFYLYCMRWDEEEEKKP